MGRHTRKACEKITCEEINIVKQFLLNRIINNNEKKCNQYEEQYETIFDLVKTTIETGEGNSTIIVGPRGSGKTLLVNKILDNVLAIDDLKENVCIVQLNGFIHTTDHLAIIDITRQMELENVVGDKIFGSFTENFEFLLNCMKTGNTRTSKPIVFVLEEFDLFCSHNNQTLLYNLFDTAQSPKVPVCVLGLTCKLDACLLLEKRVKSRFSHRIVDLLPEIDDNPRERRFDLFKELLTLPQESNLEIRETFLKDWNKSIVNLLKNKNVGKALSPWFYMENDERVIRHFLTLLVSLLSKSHQKLVADDFIETVQQFCEDEMVSVIEGLSTLELSLLIAIHHQTKIHREEPFYIPQILNRYSHFVNRCSILKSIGKPVIIKAFEHLKVMGLVNTVGTISRSNKEHQLYNLAISNAQIMEAIKTREGIPTDVLNWASHDSAL